MSASDYPQMTDLKLEVEQPTTGLRNLIINPHAALGGYGWVADKVGTTTVETTVSRTAVAGVSGVSTGLQFAASGSPSATPDLSAASAPFPVTAGQYVGAYLRRVSSTNVTANITVQIRFLDASGAVVAGGGSVNYAPGSTGGLNLGPWQVPAGAVSGNLVISVDLANGVVGLIVVTQVTLAQAATAAAVTGLGYIDPAPIYTDIIGSSLAAKPDRKGLDVAGFTVTVRDTALDPATVDLIRPGRRIKFSVLDSTGTWQTLYYGKIDAAPTVYDVAETDAGKRATITVHALDDITVLANAKAPNGYSTLAQVTSVLERVAVVPWNVNGSTDHVINRAAITTNPDASALDQIVIARDSLHAFAWMDRDGVIHVADAAHLSTSAITLDETVYDQAGPVVTWDTDEVINEITLTHVIRNATTGETTQVTWGPYQDLDSVRQWGVRHRDITVQGLTNDSVTMRAYADAVFATNADPAVRVTSANCPINAAPSAGSVALANIYDLAHVTNTDAGLDDYARITSIQHQISPGSWRVTLGFSVDGGSPVGETPSSTPAVPAGPATVGVTTPEKPHYEASKTAAQTLTTSVDLTLSSWTVNPISVGGITVATGVFTVPRAGRYLVTASVSFAGNATGRRLIKILRNGAATYQVTEFPSGTAADILAVSGVHSLAAGATLAIAAQQSSGANLDVVGGYIAITYLD